MYSSKKKFPGPLISLFIAVRPLYIVLKLIPGLSTSTQNPSSTTRKLTSPISTSNQRRLEYSSFSMRTKTAVKFPYRGGYSNKWMNLILTWWTLCDAVTILVSISHILIDLSSAPLTQRLEWPSWGQNTTALVRSECSVNFPLKHGGSRLTSNTHTLFLATNAYAPSKLQSAAQLQYQFGEGGRTQFVRPSSAILELPA